MDGLRQSFGKLLLFWAGLKLWQRVSLAAAVVVVLGLLAAAVLWSSRSSYEPLYVGLDVQDQAAIVAYLKENNIPYRLDSAAKLILLPRDQIYDTRLSLAQEGLPRGGGRGFELFDEAGMGQSEFQQKISYIRALEGELQRTISHMDAVDFAKVSIVLPEEHLFLREQKPSTAAVLLRLRAGARLSVLNVKAIANLVASSVDGLKPENVTIVDTTGRILSDVLGEDWLLYSPDGGGGAEAVTSVQRTLERQIEKELEQKTRMMLEYLYGPGNVVVRTKVDMDFDKKSSTSRVYYPDPETKQGPLRSQTQTEESYTGTQQPPGGAPGTTTNIPGYVVNTQNSQSEYNKTESTKNYEIATQESSEIVTPGNIRRLTASVVVNADLNPAQLSDLRETVASAMGFSEARGDHLVVRAMKFNTDLADSIVSEMRYDRMIRLAVGTISTMVAIAAMALACFWWYRRRKARLALEAAQKESKHVPTIQEMLTSPDLLAFQGEMAVLEEQLRAYAKNNPSEVANLVNEWISSDG
ncbi:MAG: flagellar M-ring protein FliF [Synergistaceae bacterium]|jgi:flagellar M-ring protein FliF|nr:flagellar M-ring protein FliF [Synergistaceae bacterium]